MYDIIIKKNLQTQEIMILENGLLTEHIMQNEENENIEGNIYLGIVKNVLPGMQAAFVDIGENKNTFIHLKDILPKVDETIENKRKENKNINEIVRNGMNLLVQVKRSESNKKGAKVSTHISLSGKYVVIMPEVNFVTVSQKIENAAEAEKLKNMVKSLLPKNMGAIIRTAAVGATEKELKDDIDDLNNKWNIILKKSKAQNNAPKLLFKGNDAIDRVLYDFAGKKMQCITVNDQTLYSDIIKRTEKFKNVEVKYDENAGNSFDITKQLEDIENRKIWLKCGGFITIDKTEALTAIDVNSGKYIGNKDLEQTVYTVNKEATIEIAKQLKLRDIGGIVIIDYIDMYDKKDKDDIEQLLKEELKKDRSKTQILGFTKLNLLEMTRKHIN
ncbi:MAG: Rne/Rng family ribonuclease [Clostridia bacterium]|nr:Rne/Rng family ribonuclease [Clostridia bacterium]